MGRPRMYQSNADRQAAYRQRKRYEKGIVTPYYQDDQVTLYCGDALALLPALRLGTSVTLTFTDPPYNAGKAYDGYHDQRSPAEYRAWCASWFRQVPRPLVFTPGTRNLALWFEIERPDWVACWHKANQNSRNACGGANAWEPLLVYGRACLPVDAWSITIRSAQQVTGPHPVPKDEKAWLRILADLLGADTRAVVLDPFAGSGTTLIAAKRLGVRAIGIEQSAAYCEIAARRCSQQVMDFGEADSGYK